MAISAINILIEQAALGNVRVASLIDQVGNNETLRYKNFYARFTKKGPGDFVVVMGRSENGQDQVVQEERTGSPVEAKLFVLEYLVDEVRALQENNAQGDQQGDDQGQAHQSQGPRTFRPTARH